MHWPNVRTRTLPLRRKDTNFLQHSKIFIIKSFATSRPAPISPINHCALRITHYALRITHCALRITHYALLIAHYALRIAHYALSITSRIDFHHITFEVLAVYRSRFQPIAVRINSIERIIEDLRDAGTLLYAQSHKRPGYANRY